MLSTGEAEILEQLLTERERQDQDNSLLSYTRAAWPLIEPRLPFINGPHLEAICEHLEAVFYGQIRNLIINIPPRHAKSTLVSVAFPSWVWTKMAQTKFIYASHSYALSKRDSVKTRNIVQSSWYRSLFNVQWQLAEDQNEKSNFVNTEGGSRRATSVMGSIIGEGGDILVVDDPHSPRSVKSEVKRVDALEWLDQEFFTRVNDPKTVGKIVIMQRLDDRDASKHLLKTGDWEHLCLPAEYESSHPTPSRTSLGYVDTRKEEGDPLWPDRFGKEENAKSKKGMGSTAWAGQGQQRPAPAEGAIFKRETLQNRYIRRPEDLDFFALSVDLPFDEGAKASFAVFQVWGRKGPKKYLLDQMREQCGFTRQCKIFEQLLEKWPEIHVKWVEKKANGAALINVLKTKFPGIVPITPLGSKEVRAEAVVPQFEAGDIYLPDDSIAPWIGDYVEELVLFNNGMFNDQVDATTQAISNLTSALHDDWSPTSITGESKWR